MRAHSKSNAAAAAADSRGIALITCRLTDGVRYEAFPVSCRRVPRTGCRHFAAKLNRLWPCIGVMLSQSLQMVGKGCQQQNKCRGGATSAAKQTHHGAGGCLECS